MDQTTLVNELQEAGLIEAGQRFLEEFAKKYPVDVAFWLRDRDENEWNLHIASQAISDANRQDAYAEIVRIANQMQNTPLGPLDIKLRKKDDQIVDFALDFRRKHPAPLVTIFNVPTFEGTEVNGMVLYPPTKATAA